MQNFEVWFLSLDEELIIGSHFSSFLHILPLKQNFNEKYERTNYTVTRIDGKFHQPHRMVPDQTIRLMEIFDRFEVFRLYSPSKGWKSSTFRNFPIKFPFQRMEILDILKFSDFSDFPIFRWDSLFKWGKCPNTFDLHIDKFIWLRSNKTRLVYGKKKRRVIRFEYSFTYMHLHSYSTIDC